MSGAVRFLEARHVLRIHARQLERFGGASGLRDAGLLESAVAQPQASFGGVYAHEGLFSMAAAYLFHLVSNHPFVDGNKRAGVLTAIIFLDVNGVHMTWPSKELEDLTLRVAQGAVNKQEIAGELERIVKEKA